MATVPATPKHHQPLHNFSLPFLKWGQRIQTTNHRHHRHRNGNSSLTDSSGSDRNSRARFRNRNSTNRKLDGDNGNGSGKVIDAADVAAADDGDVKPWNLRPRRLMIDDGNGNGNGDGDGDGASAMVSCVKSGRLLRGAAAGGEDDNNNRKAQGTKRRLWISLSKEEIEEDVYAFTGSRPARRPKKRNRTVQKHVDNVFPGLYLVGVSADSYRV